jgi:hypothetical protein
MRVLLSGFLAGELAGLDAAVAQPLLLAAARGGAVRVWNWRTRVCLAAWTAPPGEEVAGCALHPSGLLVAVALHERLKLLYVARVGAVTAWGLSVRREQGRCSSFAYVAPVLLRLLVLSRGMAHELPALLLQQGELVEVAELPVKCAAVCRFSGGGHLLAAAGRNNVVALTSVWSRQQVALLRGHASAVTGLSFSPGGFCHKQLWPPTAGGWLSWAAPHALGTAAAQLLLQLLLQPLLAASSPVGAWPPAAALA